MLLFARPQLSCPPPPCRMRLGGLHCRACCGIERCRPPARRPGAPSLALLVPAALAPPHPLCAWPPLLPLQQGGSQAEAEGERCQDEGNTEDRECAVDGRAPPTADFGRGLGCAAAAASLLLPLWVLSAAPGVAAPPAAGAFADSSYSLPEEATTPNSAWARRRLAARAHRRGRRTRACTRHHTMLPQTAAGSLTTLAAALLPLRSAGRPERPSAAELRRRLAGGPRLACEPRPQGTRSQATTRCRPPPRALRLAAA